MIVIYLKPTTMIRGVKIEEFPTPLIGATTLLRLPQRDPLLRCHIVDLGSRIQGDLSAVALAPIPVMDLLIAGVTQSPGIVLTLRVVTCDRKNCTRYEPLVYLRAKFDHALW